MSLFNRPIFRVNTDVIPARKILSELPRLSLANNVSAATTPSRDLSKLSLSLNNSTKTEKVQPTINSSFLTNKPR